MLKSMINLHNYVNVFKEALYDKRDLQQKILSHIKENFIFEMANHQSQQYQETDEDNGRDANFCKRRYLLH